jgi:hypothetical protein
MIQYKDQRNSVKIGYGYVVLIIEKSLGNVKPEFALNSRLGNIHVGIFWYYNKECLWELGFGKLWGIKDDELLLSNHFDLIPYAAVRGRVEIDRSCRGAVRFTEGLKSIKFIHVSLFDCLAQFKGNNETQGSSIDRSTSSGRLENSNPLRNATCPGCKRTIGPWIAACSAECANALKDR